MSGIAGIVRWDGAPVDPLRLQSMMDRVRHRGPDGISCDAAGNVGLGHASLALHKRETVQSQPLWLPDRSCAIVADARIYNREELLKRLGDVRWLSDDPLDAALVLAAYERWQTDCLDFLDGDYAFAIWDNRQHRLFAGRDPFGTKPFFYYAGSSMFAFASEPKQIVGLPGVPVEPDDLIIGEYLFVRFQQAERTFLKNIYRLQPGHFLLASPEHAAQQRWWQPSPQRQFRYKDEQDYFEQFRELLRSSVEKRLHGDYPVALHLSGGRDSSSIVVLAADIYRQNPDNLPGIETISAVYGDLSCDESVYIESVAEQVPFRNHRFYPPEIPYTPESTEDFWQVDAPIGSVQRSFTVGGARLMQALGARTLLDGVGGDEITHEAYYLRDIALRKRYLTLVRESWLASKSTRASFSNLMLDALKAAAPDSLKRTYFQLNPPPAWQPPDWVNEDLSRSFLNSSVPEPFDWSDYDSLTQGLIFWQFFDPYFSWAQEVAEARGSYAGYEVRHPYCDRPLVEFVMAMPFEHRISGGQWRYLQLRGLERDLPRAIINRVDQTTFEEYVSQILNSAVPRWQTILFETGEWESAPYVNREAAAQLFDSYTPGEHVLADAIYLWRIAFVELWLRQFDRYTAVEESFQTMTREFGPAECSLLQ